MAAGAQLLSLEPQWMTSQYCYWGTVMEAVQSGQGRVSAAAMVRCRLMADRGSLAVVFLIRNGSLSSRRCMKYFIAGVFGIAVDSVMVVIYLVRRVGGGHHDDDVTFRRRADARCEEIYPYLLD